MSESDSIDALVDAAGISPWRAWQCQMTLKAKTMRREGVIVVDVGLLFVATGYQACLEALNAAIRV